MRSLKPSLFPLIGLALFLMIFTLLALIISRSMAPHATINILTPAGEPLATSKVVVISTNGNNCENDPCSTNPQKWSGKTDKSGRISLPLDKLQKDTHIEVENYAPAKLDYTAGKQSYTLTLKAE